ncbi:hypothetical protein HDV05_007908 [Chytridiales sp. JEL 0842]|nr:hypothetical protein HDV05_007908 [Chytridiales sp. JEL 0842]
MGDAPLEPENLGSVERDTTGYKRIPFKEWIHRKRSQSSDEAGPKAFGAKGMDLKSKGLQLSGMNLDSGATIPISDRPHLFTGLREGSGESVTVADDRMVEVDGIETARPIDNGAFEGSAAKRTRTADDDGDEVRSPKRLMRSKHSRRLLVPDLANLRAFGCLVVYHKSDEALYRDGERRKYHGSLGILLGYVGDSIPQLYDLKRRSVVRAVHVRYHEDRFPGIHHTVAQLLHAMDLPVSTSPSITSDAILALWNEDKVEMDVSPDSTSIEDNGSNGDTVVSELDAPAHHLRSRDKQAAIRDDLAMDPELVNAPSGPALDSVSPIDVTESNQPEIPISELGGESLTTPAETTEILETSTNSDASSVQPSSELGLASRHAFPVPSMYAYAKKYIIQSKSIREELEQVKLDDSALYNQLSKLVNAGRHPRAQFRILLEKAKAMLAEAKPALKQQWKRRQGYIRSRVTENLLDMTSENGFSIIKMTHIKERFKLQFEMSDLGPAKYVLGIAIERFDDGMYFGQPTYAREILESAGMWEHLETGLPIDTKPSPMIVGCRQHQGEEARGK